MARLEVVDSRCSDELQCVEPAPPSLILTALNSTRRCPLVKFKELKQCDPIKSQMDKSESDKVPKQLVLPIVQGPAQLLTS